MRLIDADVLAEIFIDRMEKVTERYGFNSSEAGILSGAYKLLQSQPTIEPDLKWIPCSVRLPEEEGEYLVSFDDGFIATTGYYEGDFELWADAGEPLAWQPLPEAYREEE